MITVDKIDDLLKYFHQELAYLRDKGSEFAERYPKIAKHLELGPEGSADPHVERLIEAVAFLTANMQRDIQRKFPEYTHQFLGGLYPHLINPIPSISMIKFHPNISRLTLPEGFLIPRQTPLELNYNNTYCRFKTCYDVTLWPITLDDVRIVDLENLGIQGISGQKGLGLRLTSHTMPFNKLKIPQLDVCLSGNLGFSHKLYDAIMTKTSEIYLWNDIKKSIQLTPGKLIPMGFSSAEQIVSIPGNTHPAYGMLMDYFAFPKKFNYFRISGINFDIPDHACEIILPLLNDSIQLHEVKAANLCLGTTPIINIFEKITEPLKLDHTAIKYKLTPDLRKESVTEIHSIQNVIVINDETGDSEKIPPYFAHHPQRRKKNINRSWHLEREASKFGGYDVYLSFIDENFDPKVLTNSTVYAETLCTNRQFAADIPIGTELNTFKDIPVHHTQLITSFTSAKTMVTQDESYWNLIAHLNINHLSFTSMGVDGLKKILRLYANDEDMILIDGIIDMEHNLVTRRLTMDTWRGFVQGMELILTLDKSNFEGYSPLIFGSVIRQFLALYVSINSFIELKLKWKHTGEIWKEWIPLSGRQELL